MKSFIYSHDQGAYFPMPIQIICGVLGVIGLLSLTESIILGNALIFCAVFVIFSRCGIEVNFNTNTYRDYWGLPFIKFGKWQVFPEIEYVSVFRAKTSQIISSRASYTTISDDEIQVNLITSTRKRISVFESESMQEAFDKANIFASHFKTDILNATEREQVWVKAS